MLCHRLGKPHHHCNCGGGALVLVMFCQKWIESRSVQRQFLGHCKGKYYNVALTQTLNRDPGECDPGCGRAASAALSEWFNAWRQPDCKLLLGIHDKCVRFSSCAASWLQTGATSPACSCNCAIERGSPLAWTWTWIRTDLNK